MKFLNKKEVVSFDDVILVPQYSDITSRKQINTTVTIEKNGNKDTYGIPIISSPMSTVTEAHMCNVIRNLGGLGIIHRYNTIDFQAKLMSYIADRSHRAAAIGVSGDYKERLSELTKSGMSIVCIDVAHGDHILVENAIDFIKSEYPDLFIIAGNIATRQAYIRLSDCGANAIRTSVGSGSICTTRIQTGHGIPTMQAVIDCNNARNDLLKEGVKNVPYIIADGGIKNSGDIVKSLAAGADFVMLGSMLSGTKESPGKVITRDDIKYKRYNGMASKAAQKKLERLLFFSRRRQFLRAI
jgi:IMP dehydrogenase